MDEQFARINGKYEEFEKNLLKQGRMPLKDTGYGFWSYASSKDVFELFKKINLAKFNHILDLGSGDGRVALIASLFTKATGIEIDPELHMVAHKIKSELNMRNVQLINDDFYRYDIRKHDIVFVNPDRPMYRGLETKLMNELKGLLVVFGPHFHPNSLQKVNETFVNGTYVGVYSRQ